jgi:hypothetical protein
VTVVVVLSLPMPLRSRKAPWYCPGSLVMTTPALLRSIVEMPAVELLSRPTVSLPRDLLSSHQFAVRMPT